MRFSALTFLISALLTSEAEAFVTFEGNSEKVTLSCSGRTYFGKKIEVPLTLFRDEHRLIFGNFEYWFKHLDADVLIAETADTRSVAGLMLDLKSGHFWETQIGSQCVGEECKQITLGGGYMEGKCVQKSE